MNKLIAVIGIVCGSLVCTPSFAETKVAYSSDYFNATGKKLLEQEDFTSAIEYFHKAINLNPASPTGYVNLGTAYERLGVYESAIEHLQKALALAPSSSDVYFQLGTVYEKRGDFLKAIEYSQKALSYDSTNPLAMYNLGYAFMMRGDYEGALKQVEELRRIKSDDLADKLRLKVDRKIVSPSSSAHH
jgi:tetratricopeptide (TPR) repeat protein